MALKLRYTTPSGAFVRAMDDIKDVVATAATSAMKETGENVKVQARDAIKNAGLGIKWQNQLRVDIYPKSGRASVNAAAHIYHKIPWAGLFEEGGTVQGNPFLWLPIDANLPFRSGGRRWTPATFRAQFGTLYSARGSTDRPILLGKVPGHDELVPVFFGIASVNIPKKFDITSIVSRAADRFESLYDKHLRV